MMMHRQLTRRGSAYPQYGCTVLLVLLLGAAPVTAWAGGRSAPSGAFIHDDIISGGGAAVGTGTHVLWGAVGQPAVGQSFAASGAINHGWPTLDKVPPVITLLGNNPATVECGATYTDAGATAFDNIDGDITAGIVAVNNVNTSIKGDYTVTYDVTDTAGNPAVQVVRTVTVVDTTAPVITNCGPNQSVSADSSCQGAVPDFTAAVTATDNCTPVGSLVITQDPIVGTLLGTGDHAITLTVTDESANSSTCQATLTVEDDTNPVAACQNVTVNLSAPTLAAAALDGGSTDNCAVTSWLIDGATDRTFTCADMPSTSVTLTVADAAGNSDTCTAAVTVVDDISPSALCQNITVNLGAPTVAAAALDGGSNDNCAITAMLIDGAVDKTFTCTDMPSTLVTLRVEDAVGNFDECQATVTVVDDVPPVAVCQNITVPLSSPTITPADVDGGSTDNCGITSRLINGAASRTFTCAHLGANTITLRVTDAAGNFNECAATVTVVDDIPPTAGCRGAVTVNLSSPTLSANALNLGSSDNCGTVSYQIDGAASRTFTCADLGANTVTLTVLDGAGNTATCDSTVTVVDNILPEITLLGTTPVTVECGDTYTDAGATAWDNCDGDLTGSILTVNPVNTGVLDTYLVTYNVSDGAGGPAPEVTRTVSVVDTTSPVAVCENITVYLSSPTITPADVDGGSSDNCGIASMLINGAASITFTPADLGDNAVTLRVEDASGYADECVATVTVTDDVPVEGEGEPQGLTVTADPTEFTVPLGASVTFEVVVSGAQGVLSYQWYRVTPDEEYLIIPDATDGVYTLTDIVLEDAGEYRCEVYDTVLDETAWSPVFTLVIGTGVPVGGMLGLALASVLTALAGASVLRKKK